jgi:transposase
MSFVPSRQDVRRSADERRMVRAEQDRAPIGALRLWLEAEMHRVPPPGGLTDAILYTLVRWDALCRYLDDGRVKLDTDAFERAIRPIALGGESHLFAGSETVLIAGPSSAR